MIRASFLLVLCLALHGCTPSGEAPEPAIPTEPPYISGTITAAGDSRIRVEERPEESSGSAKADLRLTPATVVLWRSGEPAERRDLGLGTRVRVWVSGPIMESYPVQATAGTVVIDLAASQVAPRG